MVRKIILGLTVLLSAGSLYAHEYTLQSGDARLIIDAHGRDVRLSYGPVHYKSLNAPYAVTLEVNGESVFGRYSTVKQTASGVTCFAEIKTGHGSVFEVQDIYSAEKNTGRFCVERKVAVTKASEKDRYFNSYLGFTLAGKKQIGDFEFFVPGIWYRDNESLLPRFLAGDYSDHYFYFREDRLPLPVIAAMDKTSKIVVDMVHTDAYPESFYGETGVDRIVDARMQFGSLGFAETGEHSFLFVFPGIEGEKTYTGRFPDGMQKGFSYRSHPVKEGVKHAYRLSFGFQRVTDYPELVETVWKQAWAYYRPAVHKADVREAYKAGIEVLDAYLLNLNGAPGWPFSIYLPNGIARAYNYQMGFIGFQISNAYFLLRNGLETGNEDYIKDGTAVIDFWVKNSQQESGLVRTWADAYVDRKAGWRDYDTYMRVTAGGMEGLIGAWSTMKKHGIDKPEWLEYGKKYAGWLIENQEPDGSFYLCYHWKTGEPAHDSKYTTTSIVRFLTELYAVTRDPRYLRTALKAGEYSYNVIHQDYLYVGGVIDNPNIKDRESGQMAIYAFLALYDVTKDAKWKEAALQAARYTETFMFSYPVPMGADDYLTDFPKDADIVGQTLIATGHSGVDNGLAFSSFQYYRLYLMTGDEHLLHVARLIQNNTLSIMDLSGKMRYKYRGLLTECFNPQSNRGHSVRQQLPWNQASILEPMHRFMDAFGEWDIDVIEQWPMSERLKLISEYAHTQGLEQE